MCYVQDEFESAGLKGLQEADGILMVLYTSQNAVNNQYKANIER